MLDDGAITAEVKGYNELVDKLALLRRVHVAYTLRVPEGTRETVERLLSKHATKCPTAMSLKGAVEVTWSATVHEGDEVWEAEGSRD